MRDGSGASTLKFTSLSPLEDDDDLRTGSMEGITESELLLPSRSAAMAVGCGADARSAAGVTAGATSTPVGPLSSGSSENNNDDDDDEEGGAGLSLISDESNFSPPEAGGAGWSIDELEASQSAASWSDSCMADADEDEDEDEDESAPCSSLGGAADSSLDSSTAALAVKAPFPSLPLSPLPTKVLVLSSPTNLMKLLIWPGRTLFSRALPVGKMRSHPFFVSTRVMRPVLPSARTTILSKKSFVATVTMPFWFGTRAPPTTETARLLDSPLPLALPLLPAIENP